MCSLLLCNVFISCSNEEQTSNIDQEKIQFVLQSKSNEVTKAAYQLLTPEEKYFIWDERMDYILAQEDLTIEQVNFINELKSDLSIEIFSDELTAEGANFDLQFPDTRLDIFEPIQGYYYFGSLLNMPDNGTWASIKAKGANSFYFDSFKLVDDSGTALSCHCHKGSIVSPGCQYGCSSSEETKRGCGFLWRYSCNGRIAPWEL